MIVYSYPWDMLAELCQNSVDGILLYNQKFGDTHKKFHEIEIGINAHERSIAIRDTGIGFSPHKFAELLAPNGTDKEGKIFNRTPNYMLPEEFISKSDVIELSQFRNIASPMDDRQKASKLQGKAISESKGGRKTNYYAFFAPSRALWEKITKKLNPNATGEDRKYLYTGGIYIASKGMPTSIIIMEDDQIKFDVGRKSIPSRTKGTLRTLAKEIFQEFMPFIKYATREPMVTSGPIELQQKKKEEEFKLLRQLPDIGISKICYLKHPDKQEAGVVALFHELVGAGILKGYYTLGTGYKQTYDWWGVYRINKKYLPKKFHNNANNYGDIELDIIIEFKYKAEDILLDLEQNRKYFSDINLIVCWNLDETKFAKYRVSVEPLNKNETLFYGSNYRLVWPGAYNLGPAGKKYVLALRKFIEDYRSLE